MRLYRHYKNQNYRLIGHVRHSETLEEMALYDCLYPNDLGKTWVRPLEMFYGKTEVNGKLVTRFAEVPLTIKKITMISADDIKTAKALSKEIFGNEKHQNLEESLKDKKDTFLLLAETDGKAVGYKLGYRLSDETFYSWLGGVVSSFQGLGIASDLMKAQHEWCRAQGYKKIQTKTKNRFRQMLTLNLKEGFDIVGTVTDKNDEVKIIMEKAL